VHGPLHSLRKLVNQSQIDSPIDYSAILKFPDEVGLCTSSIPGIEYGVCAKAAIPSGTWIGPYEGRLVRPEQIKRETETEYMWEVGEQFPFVLLKKPRGTAVHCKKVFFR
jgi:hypothetical protein